MKKLATFLGSIFFIVNLFAQEESKKTIAVANPNIEGLTITPEVAAKMMQLELIKLDKFSVYDEFDMAEVLKGNPAYAENCYGINCLTNMGKELNVDYVLSGSFNGLGNRIAISLKWIEVNTGSIYKSTVREFDNQDTEIQRMIKLLLLEMNEMEVPEELSKSLEFKNEVITSNNVGKINNSGPRIGYAIFTGQFNEYALRPENQGGLDIFPAVSNIGYQYEGQYVGTENFSALLEGVFTISGLEQGLFIPSIAVLNGFRFGKAGWEFAFGPSFTIRKESDGFFDKDGRFGRGENAYISKSDYNNYISTTYEYGDVDSTYYDDYGYFTAPTPYELTGDEDYNYEEHLDSRGDITLSANWLMAFGRTFKAGALNVPVNVFYSASKGGGMAGVSVGFNVTQSKRNINSSSTSNW